MLIIGGIKSGKSEFVRNLSLNFSKVIYIATLLDINKIFIKNHLKFHPRSWDIFEEPLNISYITSNFSFNYSLLIIDDISIWLSNILILKKNIYFELDNLLKILSKINCFKIIISKEVNLGIISNSNLLVKYCNLLGCFNQVLAKFLNSVYMLISGIPVKIK